MAIHQKFNETLDMKGESIFEIGFELMLKCQTVAETLTFLKTKRSLTCWGINLGFKSGEVLEIDICGEELRHKIYHLEDKQVLHFVNKTLNHHETSVPIGIDNYSQMRLDSGAKKIKKMKNFDDLHLLKMMSTPLKATKPKNSTAKNWTLDPLTPSSLTVCTLNPASGKALLIDSPAPKIYLGTHCEFDNIWQQKTSKTVGKRKKENFYHLGLEQMIAAQGFFDLNEIGQFYHHIQVASSYLKGFPEEHLASFYFYTAQYIHDTHKKVRLHLLQEYIKIEPKLPKYLAEHTKLFIMRLEMILFNKTTISPEDFTYTELEKLYEQEMKIPPLLLHKVTATMMNIRIDIADIIYPHAL